MGDSLQAFDEHLVVDSHADAEVIRHFEEAAGHGGGVVFRAQAVEKSVYVAVVQAHKRGGAPRGARRGDGRVAVQN